MNKEKQWTFSREEELIKIRSKMMEELKTDKYISLDLGGYDPSKKKNFTIEKVGEDNKKIYFKKIK